MANQPNSPPDGWTMTSGTWGTAATALATGGIGPGGIQLNTGSIVSDWLSLDSTTNDIGYTATCNFLFLGAGMALTVNFVQYKADRATKVATNSIVSTSGTYSSGVVIAASANFLSATTAPFGRWEITNAGAAYVQLFSVALERIRSSVLLNNASLSSAANTWTTVTWAQANAYAAGIQSSSGGNIALRKAGLYEFCFNLTVKTTGTVILGNYIQTRILQVNSITNTSTVVSPVFMQSFANNNDTTPTLSWAYVLNVPNMVAAVGSAAFVPYYQTQVYCSLALTAVAASSSLSVVSLS